MENEPEITDRPRPYVALPVVSIALEALRLPFKHFREAWKLSLATLALMLAVNALDVGIYRLIGAGVESFTNEMWAKLARAAIVAPFAVAWSKIAIDGTGAVADIGTFPFGRTERWYAFANVLMWLAILLPVFAFERIETFGRQTGYQAGQLMVPVLLVIAATVLVTVAFLRFSFLFPAIATGRYQGLRVAWKQTRGYLEALTMIEIAIIVPYVILLLVTRHFRSDGENYLEWLTLYAIGDAVMLVWDASFACGPALAYKFLVLRKDPDAAGVEPAPANVHAG